MNKYSLIKTWPSRTLDGYPASSNKQIIECEAASLPLAIEKFNKHCLTKLDCNGYSKVGSITYKVAMQN